MWNVRGVIKRKNCHWDPIKKIRGNEINVYTSISLYVIFINMIGVKYYKQGGLYIRIICFHNFHIQICSGYHGNVISVIAMFCALRPCSGRHYIYRTISLRPHLVRDHKKY